MSRGTRAVGDIITASKLPLRGDASYKENTRGST